jgi:hypothetical protein
MIRILQEHRDRLSFKDLNEIFFEKHRQRLTNHFVGLFTLKWILKHLEIQLRNLFATKLLPPGQEIETIKMCIPVFRVERDDVVCYALDDLFEPKNIFVSTMFGFVIPFNFSSDQLDTAFAPWHGDECEGGGRRVRHSAWTAKDVGAGSGEPILSLSACL